MSKGIFEFARQGMSGEGDEAISLPSWFATMLLVGLFVAGLYGLQQYELQSKHKRHAHKLSQRNKTVRYKHKPRFEFYSILPKRIVHPKSHPSKTSTTAKKPVKPSRYILQVASFSKFSDADRLKAQLTLRGFDVKIESTKIKGAVWYRVRTGSYADFAQAQKAKQQFATHHYRTLVRHIH